MSNFMQGLAIPTVTHNGDLHYIPSGVSTLANQVLEALNKKYPGFYGWWNVAIDTKGGMIQVRNMRISGKMGFVMRIVDVDADMKNVTRYGGELLERYRLSREKSKVDFTEEMVNMPRSYTGEAIHEKD